MLRAKAKGKGEGGGGGGCEANLWYCGKLSPGSLQQYDKYLFREGLGQVPPCRPGLMGRLHTPHFQAAPAQSLLKFRNVLRSKHWRCLQLRPLPGHVMGTCRKACRNIFCADKKIKKRRGGGCTSDDLCQCMIVVRYDRRNRCSSRR